MTYQQQVETIRKQAQAAGITAAELPRFLLLFIMDLSYDRAAICEAEKELRRTLT
jgi:hypothetical protein